MEIFWLTITLIKGISLWNNGYVYEHVSSTENNDDDTL